MGRRSHELFDPARHEPALRRVVEELAPLDAISHPALIKALHRSPKRPGQAFSKSELIAGARRYAERWGIDGEAFVRKLRLKPVRTQSGVAPVTVATAPHPCPGRCLFCPCDEAMPKSYLAREPSTQRAAENAFDPRGQTSARLRQLHANGHPIDKVELNIVGGTWSSYPEDYRVWFVKGCFDALNELEPSEPDRRDGLQPPSAPAWGAAGWDELEAAQRTNEEARCRSVGLAVELRPDSVSRAELRRLRRLGVTRVQIGVQSLDDRVLALNQRGHDTHCTRRAFTLLRQGGFKIHAHLMSNLYGSDPELDVASVRLLFADEALRPDELKLYPCNLVASAPLMEHYRSGAWRPYDLAELTDVLARSLELVPPYCRVNRMMRDIPASDIVDGVTQSNLREAVEAELVRRGRPSRDIRSREIRGETIAVDELRCGERRYPTAVGEERFIELHTPGDRLVGFLRLTLPVGPPPFEELERCAIVREVHVYGNLAQLGTHPPGAAQHLGLGRRLVEQAAEQAAAAGYRGLAVISAVGTRAYYRRLGFEDGRLYQVRPLERRPV